ncbi:MAG: hypothetical protein JNL97_08160 [Verrucomicrobiales bacterium]|nr:hypothetical protein [Verrucomicrobiales bacterium]
MRFLRHAHTILGLVGLLSAAPTTRAELLLYYVGQDNLATLASGSFRGLANPNVGRLTFLYAHAYPEAPFDNHYHSIGVYAYTGTSNAPVVVPTNANFRIPEISTGQLPLTLVLSTNGAFAGKLTNRKTVENYSDPRIRSVHRILPHVTATATNDFGYGSGEYVMFHSSSRRWTNSLEGAVVAMELVEKSPGLHVGTADRLDALDRPGDRVAMGEGNTLDFTPVIWTEPSAEPGTYTLKFKLVDVSERPTPLQESGIVTFLYRVQPEPEPNIARSVTVSMPSVTEGYVLEEAISPEGPWTPVTDTPVVHTVGGGHGGAQTGIKILTQPADAATKLYRLRKL